MEFKEHIKINKGKFDKFVLTCDIGGTNTSIGIFGVKGKKPLLIFSYHLETSSLDNIYEIVNSVLKQVNEEYGIEICDACFAIAGIKGKLTNVKFDVNVNSILDNTLLGSVIVMNDFEAVGYGINLLHPFNHRDIMVVKRNNKTILKSVKAVIGAGTGLGKAILYHNEEINGYVPIASEGGHADFPIYDSDELKLIKSFNSSPISYEDLVSGKGLERIYKSLSERSKKAADIAKSKSGKSKQAFDIFTKFYARAIKNFALESLCLGGIYIAGGIAAKNPSMFKSSFFLKEFLNNYKLKDILVDIPVYVILNPNVGLYGCAFAIINRQDLAVLK